MIAKLVAHDFDINSLKLIYNYLSNRKQKVKVNSAYNIWKALFYGILHGSILENLLFNIRLCETEVTEAS